jgi:glycosyltransferase involved in cell wall biosynthesis
MNTKKNILFFYGLRSSFVKEDINILNENYNVIEFNHIPEKKLRGFITALLKSFLFLITNIRKADAIYIWFADYHSLLPVFFAKLFKKKSFQVLGGYDVTCIPELKYGSFCKKTRGQFAKYAIENVDLNLAVDSSLIEEAKTHVKKGNFKVIPTGYDSNKFEYSESPRVQRVLTVGAARDFSRIRIKGLDRFVELAYTMPNIEFMLIGVDPSIRHHLGKTPDNLIVTDFIDQNKLIKEYQNASIYAQFSIREGLPNSICESMLCGCLQIGTNAGGIRNLIKDHGIVLETWDVKDAKNAVNKLLEFDETQRINNRSFISNNYTKDQRKKEIVKLINHR